MIRLMVKSQPPPDIKQTWRAGRPWPRDGRLVDYDDKSEEDPAQTDGEPMRIGRKTFQALKEDTRITITQPGAADDIVTASAALVELKAANEKLTARVAELEDLLAAATAKPGATASESPKPKK
jgi:hypothetical protein